MRTDATVPNGPLQVTTHACHSYLQVKKAPKRATKRMTNQTPTPTPSLHRNAHGQFLPGHGLPGPGRPRGLGNLRTIALEHAEAEGVDLQDAIWSVVKSMIEAAQEGDVSAARLLLDRLPESSELAGDTFVQVITGVPRPARDVDIEDIL